MTHDAALSVATAYPWPSADLPRLARLAGDAAPLEIVDIGANLLDADPPYAALVTAGQARVVGFEPLPAALQRLHEAAGPNETYLPYAVGDGEEHTLRVCASSGFSSLFEPDGRSLALLTDFPALAAVVERTPVGTTRLDDIVQIADVDLLKIDAQGSEAMILRGGPDRLTDAVLVQVEVAHHRLYAGAPLWNDVDEILRGAGFVTHQAVSTRTWPLAPTQWADPLQLTVRQLVEADMLYVRDPLTVADLPDAKLQALVLGAGGVYGAHGLSLLALRELESRGRINSAAAQEYSTVLRSVVAVSG